MIRATDTRWQLPEGLDEILPPDGAVYERLRRQLIDLFNGWGYDIVIPPLVEYLDSLLTGTGQDLDLHTFKLTDLESGKMLGVRADMTPQVSRIDAHPLSRLGPSRLCYIGTVLRTRPAGVARSRSPVQVGAELYGHAGIDSDTEVVLLMLECLRLAQVEPIHLDVGHVAIFNHLANGACATPAQQDRLFEALQRKSSVDLRAIVAELQPSVFTEGLLVLPTLNGGIDVLKEARYQLAAAGGALGSAIDDVEALAERVSQRADFADVFVDLAELRGYHYHTGVVFAAFTAGIGQEIARGGRYDGVGSAFGRARAATGFSTDLRTLLMVGTLATPPANGILAPAAGKNAAMQAQIALLRAQGERVVEMLDGQPIDYAELGCDRVLEVTDAGDIRVVAATMPDQDR